MPPARVVLGDGLLAPVDPVFPVDPLDGRDVEDEPAKVVLVDDGRVVDVEVLDGGVVVVVVVVVVVNALPTFANEIRVPPEVPA